MSEIRTYDTLDVALAGDLIGGNHLPEVGAPVNPNVQFTTESGSQGEVVGADAAGNVSLVEGQVVAPPSAPAVQG